jgi:hypothetical protein
MCGLSDQGCRRGMIRMRIIPKLRQHDSRPKAS